MEVVHIDDVCVDDINIKKPVSYSNGGVNVFDLYYQNKFLLVLTNRMHVSSINERALRFVDAKSKTCLKQLCTLEDRMIQRICMVESYRDLFHEKERHSIVSDTENALHIRDVCVHDTTVFDLSGELIGLDRLKFQDSVRIILYLKSVWANERFYGINVKIAQIERIEPMGHKTSLFSLNGRVGGIGSGRPTLSNQAPIPPPPPVPHPPPPPPGPLSHRHAQSSSAVPKNKQPINHGHDAHPTRDCIRPSIEQILESMNKLRKTNILY